MANVSAADAKLVPIWALAGLLLGTALLFLPESRELLHLWLTRHQSAHGYLVAAAVPALLWSRRSELRSGGNRWVGALLLMLLAPLFAVAKAASVSIVAWALMPIFAAAAVWMAFGARAAGAVAFPLGYFVFAIPLIEKLAPYFQRLTALVTAAVLRLIGVESVASDVVVSVPEGTFRVTETCAGMHVMVAALATVTAYAYLERLKRRETSLLVLAGVGVAILANWARVFIVIYAGHLTDMHSSLVRNHFLLGWAVFAVLMVPLMLFARRLAERAAPPAPGVAAAALATEQGAVRVAVALTVLALAPAWGWVIARMARAEAVPAVAMPRIAGWAGPIGASGRWTPFFPGAAMQSLVAYRAGADEVEAFVAFFNAQGADYKLVGAAANVGGEDQWFDVESRSLATPAVEEIVMANELGARRVVWTWYEVRGERVLDARLVKFKQALQAFGAPARSGVVALSMDCGIDCAHGRAVLARVYADGLADLSAGTDKVAP